MYPSFSTLFINFWEFYSFPSNYFPSLYGKKSTIFHSKLHPNITTKGMSSSDKCNHPLTTWFSLYPFFFHSLLEFTFSTYQQRYHTPNKQQWWKVVSRRCPSLHSNPPPRPPRSPRLDVRSAIPSFAQYSFSKHFSGYLQFEITPCTHWSSYEEQSIHFLARNSHTQSLSRP